MRGGTTLLERVVLFNLLFGAPYKLGILWNAKIEASLEDDTRILRPMLIGEKTAAFLWGTAMSPVLAPIWMCNQLNYLDIYRQGKTPKEFGYQSERRTLLDYVFM